jgi:mRNA (guanine-N7-)-methyltransferase
VIQKFSPNDQNSESSREAQYHDDSGTRVERGLNVLDIGCGKGGDLQKWQQAPQRVEIYVGLDPAEVSIENARERYRQMQYGGGRGGRGGRGGYHDRAARTYHAEFAVQDCFGDSIGRIPIVREIGYDESTGPSRFGRGGFDVVSMMFCMHYAFESEEKARRMLKNVAGALKKGGRLIGCIPNSDVLSSHVERFNASLKSIKAKREAKRNGTEADAATSDGEMEEGEEEETARWGNDVYRVRFPGPTPEDGIFRPPFGWKYNYFLHEAVEEVPEYVVPWEAFRAIAEDYNLEMLYHKPFDAVWQSEKDDENFGPMSERMGVRERNRGPLLLSDEEFEAAKFYVAFCFYKV